MYTARRVDAAEALALGLVLEVVPPEQLEERAIALATQIAAGPPLGNAAAKRLVHVVEDDDLTRVQELSIAFVRQLGTTADGAEGVASFLERRDPVFRGR